ncbi:MAG TPA: wax ester/triacylglycerol synthase family O-acyltransferase [Burkholderiaceae bacterium]
MLDKAMSTLARKKMSSVDTAWLRMDSSGNLMMIVAVAMLDKPLAADDLKHALEQRFLIYSRFRSRVVSDVAGSWWQERKVDLSDHVVETALPDASDGGSNKEQLQDLVGKLSAIALDPHKPLWQMHLVNNCVGEDGHVRQALVARIHHCIADGVALVRVFMSMFDSSADAPKIVPTKKQADAAEENPWEQILLPVTSTSIKAIKMSSAVLSKSMGMLGEWNNLGQQLFGVGQTASQLATDAVKLTLMGDDSPTRLKGTPSGEKHVAWSEPLPLHEVKAIGKAFGCSINDVLMASVAGAIGAYLREKGDTVEHDAQFRAMVPVNLRKASSSHKLGNAFGLVPLVLPIGIEDPVERLLELHARMNDLKGSYTALVAMSLLGVLGAAPKPLQSEVQGYFSKKASAVMSNVPGPQAPLYLAGCKLDQIMFWVPQSGDIGVGISILSYNGGVQFGIVTDDAMAGDPGAIIARFEPEFEKLVMLALMSEEFIACA